MNSATQNFLGLALPRLEEEYGLLGVTVPAASENAANNDCSELELELVYGDKIPDAEARAAFARQVGTYVAGYANENEESFVALLDSPVMQVTLRFVTQMREDGTVIWERDGQLTAALAHHRPRPHAHVPVPNLQWCEDRIWLWVHRAACHLGRGEIFAALDLLAKIRAEVLAPLLALRHGQNPRRLRNLEAFGGEELSGLRASVALYDARSCEISLREAAKLYLGLREQLATADLRRNRRAELATLRHLHLVSEELAKAG